MLFRAMRAPCGVLVLLAACTQQPVQVVFKGDQVFGQDASMQMASLGYGGAAATGRSVFSAPTVKAVQAERDMYQAPAIQAAPVGGIGVQELAPLRKAPSAAAPQNTAPALKPQASASSIPTKIQAKAEAFAAPAMKPVAEQPLMLAEAVVAAPSAPSVHTAKPAAEFIWPVQGRVISSFGPDAKGKRNDGVNIAAASGAPVKASADGEVVYVGDELKGYGNMLILRHPGGWMSAYAHAGKVLVKAGDKVRQGTTVATVGQSGGVRQPQLHFSLRHGRDAVDPLTHLTQTVAAVQ